MWLRSYKSNLAGAILTTFVFAIIIFEQANNKDEAWSIVSIDSIEAGLLLAVAIFLWMLGTKQYIDSRFEELDKQTKISDIAIKEKVKQLQTKD